MKSRVIAAIAVCAVAVVAIVGLAVALSQNVVYFRTVSEAVDERADGGGDGRFRMAGEVVPGSVQETRTGVRFEVTDGEAVAAVVHRGDPPDLFKAGAPVVCEGDWGDDDVFDSDRILIRHGNEYEPPEVDDSKATGEDAP
ncbi:MAG TPA: cytochrome c maturation protein CcmE [Acidimicrobiia bacterium]